MLNYFKKLITLNFLDYGGSNFPIGWILLGTFFGLIVATVLVQLQNRRIYLTVKALIRHKAQDAASAKTLKELGLSDCKAILRARKRPETMISKFLEISEGEMKAALTEQKEPELAADKKAKRKLEREALKDKPIDFETARFYLNPSMADRAKEILSGDEVTVAQTVIFCVLLALIYVGLASISPWVLALIF